ncbi:MAG: FecR family protein [Proteobacteria bacterium]|nr:FecR family protein [Pseudomonadota bacterium]
MPPYAPSFPPQSLRMERRIFARLALGTIGLLALPETGAASEQAGHVEDIFGQAVAEMLRATRSLTSGERLFVGETIATGEASRIGMKVGEATTIRLGPEARLKLDRFILDAGGTLTLQSGPMTFERPAGARPQPITIRGAFGMIAVRGTHFFAGPSRGKMAVAVVRGSVTVTSGGESVVLNAGEGTDITTYGGKPSKPARWADARLIEALDSVR